MKNLALVVLCLMISACVQDTKDIKPSMINPVTGESMDKSVPAQSNTIEPEISSSNYGSNAQACLTEAMYFEARGTGQQGMRAVGEVILNRANSGKFPSTVCGVVNDRCQFSYTCDKHSDSNFREPAQKALAASIAKTLLTNRGKDITNGALYFHSKRSNPGWRGMSRRGQFGGNIFYR